MRKVFPCVSYFFSKFLRAGPVLKAKNLWPFKKGCLKLWSENVKTISLKLHKCDTKVVASSLQNGVRTGPLFLNKGQNVHIPILGCIASLILNSLPNIGSVHVGNPNIYLSTSIKTRTLSKENTGVILWIWIICQFKNIQKVEWTKTSNNSCACCW